MPTLASSARRVPRTFLPALTLSIAALAVPAQAQVVISQVYGGGGNAGAQYTHDFVELFNRGRLPVNIAGWSVQYAPATSSSWTVTPIGTGMVTMLAPGQYYLVQQASGGAVGVALPASDANATTAMAADSGKVALVSTTSALSGSGCPFDPTIEDFVGYGSSASCFEGTGGTATLSNTTAALRDLGGCQDTQQNSTDFTVAAPGPRNSASPLNPCPAWSVLTDFPTSSTISSLRGLALSIDGASLFAGFIQNGSNRQLRKVDVATGAILASVPTSGSGTRQPKGVATDDRGYVFFTATPPSPLTTGQFIIFDSNLTLVNTVASARPTSEMGGAALFKTGSTYYLYIAYETILPIIERYNVTTVGGPITRDASFGVSGEVNIRSFAGHAADQGLRGLELAADGTIFVTNRDQNLVYKISADGSTLLATATVSKAMDVALFGDKAYVTKYDGTSSGIAVLRQSDLSLEQTLTTGIARGAAEGYASLDISSNGTIYLADQLYATNTDRILRSPAIPIISSGPTSQFACVGGMATFSVSATGGAPITYQWRRGVTSIIDDANHTGATTATLSINPAGPGDVGSDYNVVVTTASGTATSASVSLIANPTFNATIQLEGASAGPFTRCITFDFYTAAACPGPAYTDTALVTFIGGLGSASLSGVPCGNYTGVAVRDTLHTLRRVGTSAPRFDNSNPNAITATFTGAASLLAGNVNDDEFIDILDFGGYIGQSGSNPGANTTCSTAPLHADFDGDGDVDAGDYTFIQSNFLAPRDQDPCGGDLANAPVMSISVADLVSRGQWDIARGDLNLDNRLDTADAAWVLAHGLPRCTADFNGDQSTTTDDIFAYVSAWFMNHPRADMNSSRTNDVQDIFTFLNLWFQGCP